MRQKMKHYEAEEIARMQWEIDAIDTRISIARKNIKEDLARKLHLETLIASKQIKNPFYGVLLASNVVGEYLYESC